MWEAGGRKRARDWLPRNFARFVRFRPIKSVLLISCVFWTSLCWLWRNLRGWLDVKIYLLSVCLSVSPPFPVIYLLPCLSLCRSISLFVCSSVCLCLPVCAPPPFSRGRASALSLSVSLSSCLCVCLSVCLSPFLPGSPCLTLSLSFSHYCTRLFIMYYRYQRLRCRRTLNAR